VAYPYEVAWEDWTRLHTDPQKGRGKPEALDDLLVLDLSYGNMGGLFCSSILGEFGAEVIRVEPPGGDIAREFSPYGYKHMGVGLAYLVEGRNKYHVTIDLKNEKGRELLRRLVRKADILIESFKPGVLDELGIGYRQLAAVNPGLIYLAFSTYGQFGPAAASNKPDYDITNQAMSTLVNMTGEPEWDGPAPYAVPTKVGNWYGWYNPGAWGAFGALTALFYRNAGGRGQLLDISGAEGIAAAMDYDCLWYHAFGMARERIGSLDNGVFPYTYIRVKDGYAFIAGFSDVNFTGLTNIMNRPDLREKFPTIVDRLQIENELKIKDEIEKWSVNYTADEILQMVSNYHGVGTVATARVNSPRAVMEENNWWERGALAIVDDPVYGRILVQQPPWKMTLTPPRIKWLCRPVGYDNEYVFLKHLGLGRSDLAALKREGAV